MLRKRLQKTTYYIFYIYHKNFWFIVSTALFFINHAKHTTIAPILCNNE